MIEGLSACGREQPIRARDPNDRFGMAGVSISRAVPWPPTHQALCPTCGSITASVRKALRVKAVKCAGRRSARYLVGQSAGEGRPGALSSAREARILTDDDLDRARHATGPRLADKVLVLHYGKELA